MYNNNSFDLLFVPFKALVFYKSIQDNNESYVESFDMDSNGNPINAHPLTVNESSHLAQSLQLLEQTYFQPKGILDTHILMVEPQKGKVMWYTENQTQELFFVDSLGIPNGKANVPALLWVADKHKVSIYALDSDNRPTDDTPLYYAPFFNIHKNGAVCMGSAKAQLDGVNCLEEFITAWEHAFFNSYFSHLMFDHNPIMGNCGILWEKLIRTKESFPIPELKTMNKTLKSLL